MFRKKTMLICTGIIILSVGIITGLLWGNQYVGILVADHVSTGEKANSRTFYVKIDDDLNIEEYENQKPKMGLALDWTNSAHLDLRIFKILGKGETEIPRSDWKVESNREQGAVDVLPGQVYKIVVSAVEGSSDFTLKLFKPGRSHSSWKASQDHTIGNMIFYHLTRNTTIYVEQENTDKEYIPSLCVFNGSREQFLETKNLSVKPQINKSEKSQLIFT